MLGVGTMQGFWLKVQVSYNHNFLYMNFTIGTDRQLFWGNKSLFNSLFTPRKSNCKVHAMRIVCAEGYNSLARALKPKLK